MLITKNIIQQVLKILVEVFHPSRVILFGSFARGDFDKNSDLDLLVIKPTKKKCLELLQMKRALRKLRVPIDLLLVDDSEFQDRSKIPGTIYYWANKEGSVLYER